jgi:hypothetical protein
MAQIRRVSLLICDFYVYLVACIILGYLKYLNPLKYTVYNNNSLWGGGGHITVSNPHLALEGAPIFDELCLHGQNFATYFIGMSIYE